MKTKGTKRIDRVADVILTFLATRARGHENPVDGGRVLVPFVAERLGIAIKRNDIRDACDVLMEWGHPIGSVGGYGIASAGYFYCVTPEDFDYVDHMWSCRLNKLSRRLGMLRALKASRRA